MSRVRRPTLALDPLDPRTLVAMLAWLRPAAALGQVLAIAVVMAGLHVRLPLAPLAAGIAVLGVASPLAIWRLRRNWRVGTTEAVSHVAFDLLLLGWALYFTGGATNPFITLLLVPVALAAAALTWRGTAVVVLLAGALYAVLMFRYVPLADMPMHDTTAFRVHLTGMAINFAIAILLLAVFIGRVTRSLHAQREATRRLRERILRDEGILAVASQAAEAAHELNTPLATLRTLLPELARGREGDAELRDDVQVMIGEVERCRNILHGMVEYGRRQLSGDARPTTLGEYVHRHAERFRLLCPEAELEVRLAQEASGHPLAVPPALAHALLNLLRNAFDASSENGSPRVTLAATVQPGAVEFVIGDAGRGLPAERIAGMPAASSKPDGLGMGLALARSSIDRLHGDLSVQADDHGTRIHVRVPADSGAGR